MKITENVKSVSYENGTRVATVEKIVSRTYDSKSGNSGIHRVSKRIPKIGG